MPITYDPASNKITVIGFTESSPCTFEDIYNADKAGTLILVDRNGITGTDTEPVNNTYNLRPADEKVMGGAKHDLWIEIENWSGFINATIRLIGKDEAGNDQTEDIVVSWNGVYYSSKLWTELTQTQVVSVSGSGSFDYKLVQGQWGVVSKQGESQYKLSCQLQIGDGSTETWLIDTNKMIFHDINDSFIHVRGYGHLRLGAPVDEDKKTSKDGCYVYTLGDSRDVIRFDGGSTLEVYSSIIASSKRTYINGMSAGSGHRIWNSTFFRTSLFARNTYIEIHRTTWQSSDIGISFYSTYSRDIVISDIMSATIWSTITSPVTIRDCKIINEDSSFLCFHMNADLYAINFDCKWTIRWIASNLGKIYRQYTFNTKVVDENNNPLYGARVRVWDKDGNLIIDEHTDANGTIPEQIITRGYYDKEHGNELQDYAPFILEIGKEGFEVYRTVFTPEKPINLVISLRHENINVDEEVIT